MHNKQSGNVNIVSQISSSVYYHYEWDHDSTRLKGSI